MLRYSFIQNALIVSVMISVLCPLIGVFLVLRRYSMIGDTLAHSSLAGVSLGLITGINPIAGAFIFTSLTGIAIELLRHFFKKYAELMLVIALSLSVGIALTLISSGRINANINSFLFGSILTVSYQDILTVLTLSVITIAAVIILYDKLLYITFDEEGAAAAGIKVKLINYIFAVLVAATISVSIRIVGMLVISSLIALPAAAALQLKKSFKATLFISIFCGFISIISGIFLSYYIDAAPGGIIALTSVFLLLAVIAAVKIMSFFRHKKNRHTTA